MEKIISNMEKIIIVNSGSVSKKYALYSGEELLLSAHFEILINQYQIHIKKEETYATTENIQKYDFEKAFDYFVDLLLKRKIINEESDIAAVAFRVVAPSLFFQEDSFIDNKYLLEIDKIANNSLIHIKSMRSEMNQVIHRLPNTKHLAISDSHFHKTLPEYANRYAIPNKITKDLEIYRYGYHGISVDSIVVSLTKENKLPEKVIVCHLGGGSSLTAVLNGKSIDNSMGFTPLEGVPMSTRSGSIDAGAVLALLKNKKYSIDEINNILFTESGLLGISGLSSDIRDLIEASEGNHQNATLALDMFAYSIRKNIGAFMAALGGLDLLVFTGTIGERSSKIRQRICNGLENLGIKIDKDINNKISDHEGYINYPGADVSILIKKTDEMAEMARRSYLLINK